MNDTVVTISDQYLNVLVSSVLPLLVAVVTTRFANSTFRGFVLLFFSVITGWLTTLQQTGGTFEVKATIVSIAISFITAVAAHSGVLNGTVTGDQGFILKLIKGGVGPVDERKVAASEIVDRAA